MVKVKLHFDLQDDMGCTMSSYWKEIEMPAAPTREIVFDDENFTFTPNREIIYNILEQYYYVRIVRRGGDAYTATLEKLGWEKK